MEIVKIRNSVNQLKIGNILKTGLIGKNKEHRENNNYREKRFYWKTRGTGWGNEDEDLKEDRYSGETIILYGIVCV